MIILDLKDVKLPRVNNRYNRNFSLTGEYRQAKESLTDWIGYFTAGKPKIDPPYFVDIKVGTHLDADSLIKPLFDSMQAAGVITNDKDIHEFTVSKTPVKRNQPNWLIVDIEQIRER